MCGLRRKKSFVFSVAVIVVAGIIMLIVRAAWYDYADVGYSLSGPSSLDLRYEDSLAVELKLNNEGNMRIAPISKVWVVNATITKVSIPNIMESELENYCSGNSTCITISERSIPKEIKNPMLWATIYVIPNNEAASFGIYSDVDVSFDWFHLRTTKICIIPCKLMYDLTSSDVYTLRK